MSRKNRCKEYDVGGVSITATCLKSRVVVLTGEIRTTKELATAVNIITDEAAKRSCFPRDELHCRVIMDEVPHALKLLEFGQPVRIGFDRINFYLGSFLGFFTEYNGGLLPKQELEMLQAPGDHHMSRSDRRRVRNIQRIMANR